MAYPESKLEVTFTALTVLGMKGGMSAIRSLQGTKEPNLKLRPGKADQLSAHVDPDCAGK